MAEIYTYATKGWPVIKGCSPSMSCAPRCWAKRECHRLAFNPNDAISSFHAGLTHLVETRKLVSSSVSIGPNGSTAHLREHRETDIQWTGLVKVNEAHLQDPLKWKKPERVAVAYHGDIGRAQMIEVARIFDVMEKADNHLYLLLTKCAAWFVEMLDILWSERKEGPDHRPPQHIMVGASIMSQPDADAARDHMAALAAAGWPTWVSYEPAIGPVDWRGWEFLKFMAVGGESGKNARPMHPDWARASRDFCAANGIRFTFKQWGSWEIASDENGRAHGYAGSCMPETGEKFTWLSKDGRTANPSANGLIDAYAMARVDKKAAGRLLDGREWNEFPEVTHAR